MDPCQLDVDHIDEDHDNNDSNNLQTLCSNCHRLKTKFGIDWKIILEKMEKQNWQKEVEKEMENEDI